MVLPWGPAQLGLDGLAYAPGSVELEDEDEPPRPKRSPRQLWLDGVEAETEMFRTRVAGRHRHRAAKARADGEANKAHWHETRADGARARFDRVRGCGTRTLVSTIQCSCRGRPGARELELPCSDWKACVSCRGKRARKYRARFRRARQRLLEQYRFPLRVGRWGERFVTLTVPHVGSCAERMDGLKQAWPRFIRQVKAHLTKDRGLRENLDWQWCAVLETTCGVDRQGHPHLHVYMLAPFLHHVMLRVFWARALPERYAVALPERSVDQVLAEVSHERQRAELRTWLRTRRGPLGRPLEVVPWPVVDVRRARNVEEELIKYLVKDAERDESGELVYMEPEVYARIYESYAGRRSIWTSRGFWGAEVLGVAHCPECGCCDWRVEIFEPGELLGLLERGRPRGPPGSVGTVGVAGLRSFHDSRSSRSRP